MKYQNLLAACGLMASTAMASPLPMCGPNSATPCTCPSGTQYSESVTTQIIGASAQDVEELTNDFFKCGWLGAVPYLTQGPDNTVGSVRTTLFPTPIGVYNISETIIEYCVKPDGSFIQRFEQLPSTVPVEYHTGNGSFSGYWVTLEATSIFQYETLMRWSIYACETGHARNFAKFHEGALNNATSILKEAGKIMGISTEPVSAQAF